MRRIDALFLCCVMAFAGLFAVRSITQAVALLPGQRTVEPAASGVAGQARDVDMRKLKALLERRALSDHEARFYEPKPSP